MEQLQGEEGTGRNERGHGLGEGGERGMAHFLNLVLMTLVEIALFCSLSFSPPF